MTRNESSLTIGRNFTQSKRNIRSLSKYEMDANGERKIKENKLNKQWQILSEATGKFRQFKASKKGITLMIRQKQSAK